jgi:hypothetical protein
MSNNFELNDKENWTLKDAYISYTKDLQDLTAEKKLSKFHAFLVEQKTPMVSEWLKGWKVFYRIASQKEEQAQSKGEANNNKQAQSKGKASDDNTGSPQNIMITHSKNKNFSFNGVVNNHVPTKSEVSLPSTVSSCCLLVLKNTQYISHILGQQKR